MIYVELSAGNFFGGQIFYDFNLNLTPIFYIKRPTFCFLQYIFVIWKFSDFRKSLL